MGQGCTKVPRPGAAVPPVRRASDATISATRGSSHQPSTIQQAPLCNHNVCSILRKKDWEATERMILTGDGVDISLTKFLERALYEGCPTPLLELIIRKGANPLESTRCLSDAILGKVDYRIVRRLLDLGCSPNQESEQDKLKRTPMHFACQTPTAPEIVELLVERGGDLNKAVGERLWTPLHYLACANQDPELLRRLVYSGGDINVRASDGTTPMAVAAYKSAPAEFFRTMLELGADPSIETRLSRNPLYFIRNQEDTPLPPTDLRLILLDPKIRQKQVLALIYGLHARIGAKSPVKSLNSDLVSLIGQFLLGPLNSKCDEGRDDELEELVAPRTSRFATQ